MSHFLTHISLRFMALAAIAVASCGHSASAQTCRMRVSVGTDGSKVEYREVYEYDYVWQKPSFPGGDSKLVNFINKHRRYPRHAYKNGIEGRVICSFIVNVDGGISNVQVFKGVESSLNEEALRRFRMMPNWNPGRINGVPVPVRVIRAVPFRK